MFSDKEAKSQKTDNRRTCEEMVTVENSNEDFDFGEPCIETVITTEKIDSAPHVTPQVQPPVLPQPDSNRIIPLPEIHVKRNVLMPWELPARRALV